MARTNDAFIRMFSWAVGRHPESPHVAIKFNDLPPILVSIDEASEIAAALRSEANRRRY